MKKEKFKSVHNRKKQKDYDLSKISDRKNYISAINRRIKETAKTFGLDSTIYKQTITNLKQMFIDKSIIKENKEGILYLSKSKKYVENASTFSKLERQNYINKPTVNEYLNQTLQKMKERGEIDNDVKMNTELQGPPTSDGKYPTVRGLVISYTEETAKLGSEIREDYAFLYGYEDDDEVLKAINTLHIKGRRKTYEELKEIRDAIDKVKTIINYDENDPYKDF